MRHRAARLPTANGTYSLFNLRSSSCERASLASGLSRVDARSALPHAEREGKNGASSRRCSRTRLSCASALSPQRTSQVAHAPTASRDNTLFKPLRHSPNDCLFCHHALRARAHAHAQQHVRPNLKRNTPPSRIPTSSPPHHHFHLPPLSFIPHEAMQQANRSGRAARSSRAHAKHQPASASDSNTQNTIDSRPPSEKPAPKPSSARQPPPSAPPRGRRTVSLSTSPCILLYRNAFHLH